MTSDFDIRISDLSSEPFEEIADRIAKERKK
jgi:hypothetical protein